MTGEFLVKSGGSPSNQEYSDFTRLDSGFFRGTTSQCAQKMCMVSSHVQRWILRRLSHKRLQILKQAMDEGLITSPEYSSRREAALRPSDPERSAKRWILMRATGGQTQMVVVTVESLGNYFNTSRTRMMPVLTSHR